MSPDEPVHPPAPDPDSIPLDPAEASAARLRRLGFAGAIATISIALAGPVLEPLGAVLTLIWARASRTPWNELGFVRSKNWWRTVTLGILSGVLLKLAMKSLVMPLLGADPVNQAYRWLTGNTAALPNMIFLVIVGAGFNEEMVFRGFLFLQFRKLLGASTRARVITVIVTSLYFGIWHYPGQGLPGAEQATVVGLVMGTWYARTRRIWPAMIAHAAFDLTAVAMIFYGLERKVAHWFLR